MVQIELLSLVTMLAKSNFGAFVLLAARNQPLQNQERQPNGSMLVWDLLSLNICPIHIVSLLRGHHGILSQWSLNPQDQSSVQGQ